MSLYTWKVGEIALAKICKKVYAKVKIAKNEDGLFHDEKVLAISANEDGAIEPIEQLCYHVQICRTGQKLWLPYTCLYLAERSRPFYGSERQPLAEKPIKTNIMPNKRKLKEDHTLTLEVKPTKIKATNPDLNITFDMRHMVLKQVKYENAFKEFVRRGMENLFDEFYELLERDEDRNLSTLHYLRNVNASTEDKLEIVVKDVVTEKEMENYLHQCWRYNFVLKQDSSSSDSQEGSENSNPSSPTKPVVTIHTMWCLVCGQRGKLSECPACPSSYHLTCRREWLLTVIHRKNPPQKPSQPITFVQKILSSTRTIQTKQLQQENDLCPSCMWGPNVGYDDVVWHKLGTCQWWPARVLTPGSTPSCLLSRSHSAHQWPLKYYGAENYSWGDVSRMSLFLPSHTSQVTSRDPLLQQGLLDACDDYIAVYLT